MLQISIQIKVLSLFCIEIESIDSVYVGVTLCVYVWSESSDNAHGPFIFCQIHACYIYGSSKPLATETERLLMLLFKIIWKEF